MMFKRSLCIGIIVLCLAFSGSAFAEKALKMGFVNMRKVFYEYKKTKEFNATLGKEDAVVKEEIEKKTQGIRRLRDEIDLLSEEAQEKKQPELRKKIKELDDFRRGKVEGLLQKKDKMFKEIRKDIVDVSEKYATKNGYDLLFDEAIFVYSSKKYNVTDEILKRLNK